MACAVLRRFCRRRPRDYNQRYYDFMRDIRPASTDKANATPPPAKKPPLNGLAVPVNPIHLGEQGRDVAWQPASADDKKLPAPRPLFYPKKIVGSARAHRLGSRERLIMGIVALGVGIALIIAVIIFLPSAHITLALTTSPLLIEREVAVQVGASPQAGAMAGQVFSREVQAAGEVPVSSTEVVGEKARGAARIINRTVDEQKIKENSRLTTTDGKLIFFMQSAAIIAPQSDVRVQIEAAEAGPAYNLEPQRLDFLLLPEGSRRLIYAEIPERLTGGSGEEVSVVGEEDLKQIETHASEVARANVESEIRSELSSGFTLVEESWSTQISNVTTETKVGDRTSTIPYTAQARVRTIGYEERALKDHLKQMIEGTLDENYMLFPGELTYETTLKEVDWEKGLAALNVKISHTTIPRLSFEALRDKLAGRPQAEAERYLKDLPGIEHVKIELAPFWVTSIPRIPNRITIDIEPSSTLGEPQ